MIQLMTSNFDSFSTSAAPKLLLTFAATLFLSTSATAVQVDPSSPMTDSIVNGSTPIEAVVTDAENDIIQTRSFSIRQNQNLVKGGTFNATYNFSDLPSGSYNVTYYANDSQGQEDYGLVRNVTVLDGGSDGGDNTSSASYEIKNISATVKEGTLYNSILFNTSVSSFD
ncbi:MAG: hypothetical protein ABEJ36_06180, partial [Candidatus Nanosalina sp.]